LAAFPWEGHLRKYPSQARLAPEGRPFA
jgi:hypothetical protein